MKITQSQAVKNLLLNLTHKDLADNYNINMEVQVNVSQGNGQRVEGEYKGKHWQGWTDGLTTWKSFRIPWNAATNPDYDDKIINFDLADHVEAIGMTGWDWKHKKSRWVAFDFDSITGHKQGLTTDELNLIKEEACKVPWVSVRTSTSGNGLHLYVYLLDSPTTNNHNEHSALARAILGQLAAITGFDFFNKVDICGGNMWVWHKRMNRDTGLKLIKLGERLKDIPPNWRDHIKVVRGGRRKTLPQEINDNIDTMFEELTGQYVKVKLDEDHKKVINYLRENNCVWWWDQDNYMLVTHTVHLRDCHETLNLKGIFKTDTGQTTEHNCFCFPIRKGGWSVRRFTPGVREHESWTQDGSGWTKCYYNCSPDLPTAARTYEGTEHPSGGYVFRMAESAQQASLQLGADLNLPPFALVRPTKLKQHKDGRLIAEIDKESHDPPEQMTGWIPEGKKWKRVLNINLSNSFDSENRNFDDILRHLVTEQNTDCGWVVKADSIWVQEPVIHVRYALKSLGLKDGEIHAILGDSVFKRWTLVNKPFEPEYPGDRQWNREACQLSYYPSKNDNLNYPTWMKILQHVGRNLTPALESFPWAKTNNILTGEDYLKCWIASVFQEPSEPLPYLFLFGPESSGKSIFHEALSLLITSSGYARAEQALVSQQGFNKELLNAIFCVVEEVNLSKNNSVAYTRIKDWVTSLLIPIHPKGGTPYLAKNTTHWIQCSNDITFCPVFPGDTRITMIYVEALEELVNKRDLLTTLKKEAGDFLGEMMRLELPKSCDRLNVPVVTTSEKFILQKKNQNALQQFIEEQCYHAPGYFIKFSDFYDAFIKWLDPTEAYNWSKQKIGKMLELPYVKGRMSDSHFYIGNISFSEINDKRKELTVISNRLVSKE